MPRKRKAKIDTARIQDTLIREVIREYAGRNGWRLVGRACAHIDQAEKGASGWVETWDRLRSGAGKSRSHELAIDIFCDFMQRLAEKINA